MVTIKEVSELAKVSQATVSRVLNHHPSVKPENAEKVFSAVETLGYTPNAFAQALASSRSNSIGMLVGSLDGPFYGPLMHHAEAILRLHKVHLIVTSGQESYSKEQLSIDFLRSKKVDGLIIYSDMLSDDELISIAKKQHATIVINRYIHEISEQCIFIDNEHGGYLATKYLLEQGHTKVACITGQLSKVDSRERLQGYRNALAEFNIAYDANLVVEGRFDHHENHQAAHRLLGMDPGITAVFCQNDTIALAVYDVAAERGLRIGADLSVIGFDNSPYCQHIRPRLTTVNFPVVEMAHEAAKGVLALLNKQHHSLKHKLTPELIIRDSVKNITAMAASQAFDLKNKNVVSSTQAHTG